jgi:hypothetical protein
MDIDSGIMKVVPIDSGGCGKHFGGKNVENRAVLREIGMV